MTAVPLTIRPAAECRYDAVSLGEVMLRLDPCARDLPRPTLKNPSEVKFTMMAWVDWYNDRRLHATLPMITPAEHEAAHCAAATALQPEPQPV